MAAAFARAFENLRDQKDQFHRNIRRILDTCYPGAPFELQLERTWITESVKCSAAREAGYVRVGVTRACRERFLARELALFPRALVVAMGRKAAKRLEGHPDVLPVDAAAPPRGGTRAAWNTWATIPRRLEQTRAV